MSLVSFDGLAGAAFVPPPCPTIIKHSSTVYLGMCWKCESNKSMNCTPWLWSKLWKEHAVCQQQPGIAWLNYSEKWLFQSKLVIANLCQSYTRKSASNPKVEVWKMIFLFNWVIGRWSAVDFPGCTCDFSKSHSATPMTWICLQYGWSIVYSKYINMYTV